jgi:hypothetical protein
VHREADERWPTWAMTAMLPFVRVIGVDGIHIWIDEMQPPTGRVVTGEGGPAQLFMGWLQLLTILANALQPPGAAPLTGASETPPSGPGG